MNKERREEIEALVAGATEGPWEVSDTSIVSDDYCIAVIEDDGGYQAPGDEQEANARFIAAARTIVPELLADNEALEEQAQRDNDDILDRQRKVQSLTDQLRWKEEENAKLREALAAVAEDATAIIVSRNAECEGGMLWRNPAGDVLYLVASAALDSLIVAMAQASALLGDIKIDAPAPEC